MNLSNKLFAGFTAMSVVAMSLAPVANVAVFADNAEDAAAYDWALDSGLTTKDTFAAFAFENAITREQAARFLVKGAEALEIDLESDQTCAYKDLASADQTLVEFINEGCELGIFKAQDNFNPKGTFTREQAELTVARILFGFDEVNSHAEDNDLSEYAAARDLLMDEGVIKVDVPGQSAVKRGHLLLMLYRQSDVTPVDPSKPVLPGSAEVSLVSAAGTQNVAYDEVNVKVGTIKLTAGSNGAKVSSVELTRDGLATFGAELKAKLVGASAETSEASFSSSTNKSTLKFSPALDLTAGASQIFDVYVSVNGTGTQSNNTHNFKVTNVVVANGTASGSPVILGTVKTTSAAAKTVSVSFENVDASVKAGDTAKTIAKVNVEFDKAAWTLDRMVLTTSTGDKADEAFSNAKAYINGVAVGTVGIAKKKLIVSGLNQTLAKGDDVIIEIKADVTYIGDEVTFNFGLAEKSDLYLSTGLTADSIVSGNPVEIKGYNLKVKNVSIVKDMLPNTKKALLYQATISAGSDIIINDFVLTGTSSTGYSTLVDADSVVLNVGGEEFEVQSSTGYLAKNDAGILISAGQTVVVKVTANVGKNADGKIRFEFGVTAAENDEGDNINLTNIPSADLKAKGTEVTIAGASATVKKVAATTSSQNLYSNGDEQEIGKFSVKAKNDSLTLKELILTGSQLSGNDMTDLDGVLGNVSLYVGTGKIATASVDGNEIKFTSLNYAVAKDATVNFILKADLGDVQEFIDYNQSITLNVTADTYFKDSKNTTVYGNYEWLNTYNFGAESPIVTLTLTSNTPSFLFTLDNKGDDEMNLTGVQFKVVGPAWISGALVCLTTSNVNNCDGDVVATGTVSGTTLDFTVPSTELGSEEYYVVFDAAYIVVDNYVTVTVNKLFTDAGNFNYGNISATYTK